MINKSKDFTTASAKKDEDWLIHTTDMAITELVRPKYDVLKAYNYYHGIRDPEQFRYLEENFGIGNPTSIEFTPLLKKHVDAIVGEYIDTPILPKISCKDSSTLDNIGRDLQLEIYNQVMAKLKLKLNNSILNIFSGKAADPITLQDMLNIIDDVNENFISKYEIAALDVIEWIIQDIHIDFQNKLKTMLTDLLIAGMAFYKVQPTPNETGVEIEVLNPLLVFTDYNPESTYRNKDYRSVVVKYMTRTLILARYGKKLTKVQLGKLENDLDTYLNDTYSYYVRNDSTLPSGYPAAMPGIISFKDVSPTFPRGEMGYYFYLHNRLLPVHEVEWLVTDKQKDGSFIMTRYETVRIGVDIYVLLGESEYISRTMDNPELCTLAVNGIYYLDRNSNPYSLILSTMFLLDRYDLVNFFKLNLIASSGSAGNWMDVSQLPTFLGEDTKERIYKWLAYKKATGLALIDTSQEGRNYNANTIYAGFDDSLRINAVLALMLELENIEQTCSSITGVFRERLNGINLKDAVSNVAVGARNSFTITRQYYQQMDRLTTGILADSLNIAKIVFKNGLKGTLILGDKSRRIFTVLPEHFCMSDYDVHILPSSDVIKLIEEIKQWAAGMISAGVIEPLMLVEIATARSLTELKLNVNKSITKTLKIQELMQELAKLNELLLLQLLEALKLNQLLLSKVEQLSEKKLLIEADRIDKEDKREWFKNRERATLDREMLKLKSKLLDAEVLQLYDDNNRNDEIKNI